MTSIYSQAGSCVASMRGHAASSRPAARAKTLWPTARAWWDGRPQTPTSSTAESQKPRNARPRRRPRGQIVSSCSIVCFGCPPASLHRLTVLHLLPSMAAAHLFCSAPAAYRAANPRPLATRGRAHRATPSRRFFPCRASLSPDGSLAMLGAPSPRTVPPMRKPYMREHSCLIFPPPRGRRPLAVIKFLGGAFIGAVPEVTYG